MKKELDLYTSLIFRFFAISIFIWFLYSIRNVIALFFISIIITASLEPIVEKLKSRFGRKLSVSVVYITFLSMIGIIISIVSPIILGQFSSFLNDVHSFIEESSFISSLDISIKDLGEHISKSFSNILSTTANLFSLVISIVAVLSMSFYMSLRDNGLKKVILTLVPHNKEYIANLIDRIKESFGRWMMGQLITMIFVGVLYYIILLFFDVPYASVLAVLGGLLEIIPYFGPISASIPAILFGFTVSSWVAVAVGIAYFVVNLIENQVLVPKIMNKAVGLDPVFVILSLLIGAKIGGIIGMFLAVPIAGAVGLFVRDLINKKI